MACCELPNRCQSLGRQLFDSTANIISIVIRKRRMENLRKIIHLSRSQPDIPTSHPVQSGLGHGDENSARLRRHRSPGGIVGFRDHHRMSGTTGKRKEIYKYLAPWPLYSMNWSVRPDKRFRLALGSFVEEYNNKVQIISLDEDTSEFSAKRLVCISLLCDALMLRCKQ